MLVFFSFSWHTAACFSNFLKKFNEAGYPQRDVINATMSGMLEMASLCGYNMGDYLAHWLSFSSRTDEAKLPKIYCVNWFRKSADNKWLWPGFGDNSRVLKWIFERLEGKAKGVESPIGVLPARDALDLAGLAIPPGNIDELLKVSGPEWRAELPTMRDHFNAIGPRMPKALYHELQKLEERLASI